MNLSAENIGKIRELVRSGYPLKARDAKDLLGHNDHLVELLEARGRLMLGVEIERDQLKAENEALRKDQTDWQAECLKRGFEYVRESDDHYVLADVPEMADLLGSMLGVEVRSKENDGYEEANSQLSEQIEGLINTIHSQESMRKDAERWRFVRNPTATGSPFAVWSERTNLFLGKFADEAIDAAMANGEQS